MTVKTLNKGVIQRWHCLLKNRSGFDVFGRNLEEAKRDSFMIINYLNVSNTNKVVYAGIYKK